jgi:hypothetical protein
MMTTSRYRIGMEVSYQRAAWLRQVGVVVEVSGDRVRVLWHTQISPNHGAEPYTKRTWVAAGRLAIVVPTTDPLGE